MNNPLRAILLALFLGVGLLSCGKAFDPIYNRENIADAAQSILKKEYNIDSVSYLVDNTLWLYIPQENLFSYFEMPEENMKRFRYILRSVNIVLRKLIMNSERDIGIEFYVVATADIKNGILHLSICSTKDYKKFEFGDVSIDEIGKRFVQKVMAYPRIINDKTGQSLNPFAIKFPNFLAEQIAYRLRAKANEEAEENDFYKTLQINWEIQGREGKSVLTFYVAPPDKQLKANLKTIIYDVINRYSAQDLFDRFSIITKDSIETFYLEDIAP